MGWGKGRGCGECRGRRWEGHAEVGYEEAQLGVGSQGVGERLVERVERVGK